jgi:hypothetical protein
MTHEAAPARRPHETRSSWHKISALVTLAGFVALFMLLGFAAGWRMRWSEDLYAEEHQQNVAERAADKAAVLVETQMIHDFNLRGRCAVGE